MLAAAGFARRRAPPRPRRDRARGRRLAMSETISISETGRRAARDALETCVGAGGVAVFPADTVYGLACDPLDPGGGSQGQRAQAAPGRQAERGHVLRPARDARADRDARAAHPRGGRGAAARPGDGRRRQPAAPLSARLRRRPRSPRAAADRRAARGARCGGAADEREPSGEPPPRAVDAIEPELRSAVDLVIDGGELPGTASTVVDLSSLDAAGGGACSRGRGGRSRARAPAGAAPISARERPAASRSVRRGESTRRHPRTPVP